MTQRAAVAGTHEFVVPDPQHARMLAEALSGYGFFLVTAKPDQAGPWRVTAYDEGPYPAGVLGSEPSTRWAGRRPRWLVNTVDTSLEESGATRTAWTRTGLTRPCG